MEDQTQRKSVDNHVMLLKIMTLLTANSAQHLRMAYREEDANFLPNPDACHFLKLDGNRLGHDIEAYSVAGQLLGWENVLPIIYREVMAPLKNVLLASYRPASVELYAFGERLYPPSLIETWRALFA